MKLFIILSLILLKSCSGDSLKPLEITPEKQAQIYSGLITVRERARCAGYFNRLDDFKTRVVQPEGVSDDGEANYVWHNKVKVAGWYDRDKDLLVLVDQPNLTAITMHEATHRVYRFNDKAKDEATKNHAPGVNFDLEPCK